MVVAGVLVAVLAIFGGFGLAILLDLEYEFLDSVLARVRDRPALADRAPYFRPLRRIGGSLVALAGLPLAGCLKARTGDQLRILGVASMCLLGTGLVFLGLWWVLASRRLAGVVSRG